MATGPVVTQEYPSGWKPSQEDELILQQPYAEAVSFMSQRSDLVVYAVKRLQNQRNDIEVTKLLDEVENLQRLEKEGKALPPLSAKNSSPEHQRLGSDGEQESDSSEPEASREGDLQTDGEPLVMQNKTHEILLPEVAVREDVPRKDALKQNAPKKDAEKKDNAGAVAEAEGIASRESVAESPAVVQRVWPQACVHHLPALWPLLLLL